MLTTNIKSAIVSTVLMALVVVLVDIIQVGDIFKLDWSALINAGVISLCTGVVSILKSTLTKDDGTIAGVQIK